MYVQYVCVCVCTHIDTECILMIRLESVLHHAAKQTADKEANNDSVE